MHDPDRCCALRKVQPLDAERAHLDAWITAIRRDQTPERATAGVVERDRASGLVKVNPLARWSHDEVWDFIRDPRRPVQPAARSGLSEHRLRAVHDGGRRRRGSASRPVARTREDRVRPAPASRWRSRPRCTSHARRAGDGGRADPAGRVGRVRRERAGAARRARRFHRLVHRPVGRGQEHAGPAP